VDALSPATAAGAPWRQACAHCGVVAPIIRLPVSSLAPGALLSSDGWLATAAMLEAAGACLIERTRGDGRFNHAQARSTAGKLREAAAEIRANLALEEDFACRMR
jgi:hypothetical protein